MLQKIIPNLWFDTEAEEAANFYISVFDNSRIVTVAHYTGAGPRPAGMVMSVEFELEGQRFVGINGGPEFTFSEAVSFQITCETQDEVDYYWQRLSEGGQEGPCGWLKDRFGLSWQVVPTGMDELFTDPDPERARRAMQAMLGMTKLDIAALRSAADGELTARIARTVTALGQSGTSHSPPRMSSRPVSSSASRQAWTRCGRMRKNR
jgi:predicted 3-demethylubiquinone-9 3-methyltransferase (glyoxalase superfamily)